MTMAERLLFLAQDMADRFPRSLTAKRRAVSTAYYAVFHAIASMCATQMISGSDKRSFEYERIYRALEHGSLKNEFNKPPLNGKREFKEIGVLVAELQSERHKSDYLPTRSLYTTRACQEQIDNASLVMDLLNALSDEDRRTLAVSLLFKNRPQ